MAAGLTDYPWTMGELLHYRVPLPAWVAPKRYDRLLTAARAVPVATLPPTALVAPRTDPV